MKCIYVAVRIEFSVSQFSDINHIIHESVIGLIVSSWWRFKACITSTQESVLSRGTRPLAGLKGLVFVVARVRNSEARKEITLNTFTLYREKHVYHRLKCQSKRRFIQTYLLKRTYLKLRNWKKEKRNFDWYTILNNSNQNRTKVKMLNGRNWLWFIHGVHTVNQKYLF